MKFRMLFVIAASLMFGANLSYGYAVAVSNASFESPTPDGGWSGTSGTTNGQWVYSFSDWTVNGTGGTWRPGTGMFTSIPHGSQVAFLTANSSISQTTAEVLKDGYTYTLSAMVGTRDNAPPDGNDTIFSGAKIELLADGIPLIALNPVASATSGTPTQGGWTTVTLNYTFNALLNPGLEGKFLALRLSSLGSGNQTNYDLISLTAVPLPAAAWLFGSALLGLGWTKRFRRQSREALIA